MTNTTDNRLARLREARQVVEALEDELGGQGESQVQRMRSDLQQAGSKVRYAGYDRKMEDAMGRAAGIAIGSGLDEIADRATRVMDGEIEFSSDPLKTVEKTTDDRGRLSIGSEFGEQHVEVAVLRARNPDGA